MWTCLEKRCCKRAADLYKRPAEPIPESLASEQVSELFFDNFLQDVLIKRQIRHQLL